MVGPDAEALLQAAVTRNIRKLATGQVVYTALCNETGGMLDDATVFRLGADKFRFVGGDEYDGTWLRLVAERLGLDQVWVKHSTDHLHNIAVQGPKSRDLLRDLVWTPPTQPQFDSLGWFRFAIGRLGGPEGLPLIISRTGYTGELGYELWCHPRSGLALWDAVWEAGAPLGLTPLGLEALDILRIEAGLIFAGYEFCDQVDPFEAGIGFTVPLKTKEDDFTGRAALERRKASPQRVLVGLELEGNEPAAHGDCVHAGRSQVGVITSGTRSPVLRKNIALCRMAVEYSELGTAVDVGKLDGQRKRIPATVVRFPFYDPDKTRPRSAGEPFGHDQDGRPVDHGLVMLDAALVVAGQPPVAHQPAECPFDDPAAADDLEGVRAAALDDFQRDRGGGLDPGGDRGAVVAAVGPHDLQRAHGAQQADDQELEPGPVADRGGGHHDRQQPALHIDGEVQALPVIFFPPWYPLVCLGTVSAHLTIWESTMQADGCAARPCRARSDSRSRAATACGSPRLFHRS